MRMPTFNKLKDQATCMYCHKNKVPINRWNRPCEKCKKKRKETARHRDVHSGRRGGIARRRPAAVIKTDAGEDVYVDKFGKEVENPGYDLQNDPRGYRYTGVLKDKKFIS